MITQAYDLTTKAAHTYEKAVEEATGRSNSQSDQVAREEMRLAQRAAEKVARTTVKTAEKTAKKVIKATEKTARKTVKTAEKTVREGLKTANKAIEKTAEAYDKAGNKVAEPKLSWTVSDPKLASVSVDKNTGVATVTIKNPGRFRLTCNGMDGIKNSSYAMISAATAQPRVNKASANVEITSDSEGDMLHYVRNVTMQAIASLWLRF